MIPASGRCAAAAARCSRRARSCARLDSRGALARGADACLPSPLRAEDCMLVAARDLVIPRRGPVGVIPRRGPVGVI